MSALVLRWAQVDGIETRWAGPTRPLDALAAVISPPASGGGGGAVASINARTGAVVLAKADVGLANADNTSDVAKPVSTAQQTALDAKADASATTAALALKAPIANPTFTGTVGGVTAAMVGLGNVSNTSDANKPISTAQSTAIALKLDAASASAFGLTLIDDVDAATARGTLGLGTLATQSGTFSGSSSGTNTGDQTTVTGNAGSATVLQTARTINGVSFNGSANITVNAVDATARVPDTRTITTTAPLAGGGALSGNLTISIGAASGVAAGSMSSADFTKLAGIATGATANSSDATLIARANHTGTQAVGTITGNWPVAQLGSGTGASSTTFWRGDGTWATPAGGGGVTDGDKGDITVTGTGATWTIDAGVVTLAKQADMATGSVVYRKTAAAGPPEVQSLATLKADLGLTGTNGGDQTITLTGDVTGSGTGSFAATIAAGAVTNAKCANMANSTISGRASAGAGVPEDLTIAQVNALIDNRFWGFQDSDFHIATTTAINGPFQLSAISAGIASGGVVGIPSSDHPGVIGMTSSTTANSGVRAQTSERIRIGGGEIFDAIIRTPPDLTTVTIRLGYNDGTTVADAVDGAYFELIGSGVVVGKTASNSTRTTSSTIATLAVSTWYHFRISVNAAATSVTFEVFDDAGTSQGSQSITTNIPTAAGRETQVGIVATSSGIVAIVCVFIDYMRFGSTRKLVRGAI